MFLFGNYNGFRQLLGMSNVAIVPDAVAQAGRLPSTTLTTTASQCSAFPGIDQYIGVAPGLAPYLALYPLPNRADIGGGEADYRNDPIQPAREDFGTVRFNCQAAQNDSVAAVHTLDDGVLFIAQVTDLFANKERIRTQIVSLSET